MWEKAKTTVWRIYALCLLLWKNGKKGEGTVKIEKLPYYIDLYETRSYTKTARKNYISQTSVTQFINGLEEELQVKLFDRTTLPIQPTAAGNRFYQDAKALVSQYQRIKEELAALDQNAEVPVRLCYTSKIDLQIMVPFVIEFKKRHPNIVVEVEQATFKEASKALWVRRCDAVIGIDFESEYTAQLETLLLYQGEYQALVAKSHPLFGKTFLQKDELYHYPLVMLSPQVIGRSYEGMLEHARQDGYYPNIQRTADDLDTELFLILTENLIGFVPENYMPSEYAGQLQRIPIADTHHRFQLEMKYRSGENPSLDLFVKELTAYLKTE